MEFEIGAKQTVRTPGRTTASTTNYSNYHY